MIKKLLFLFIILISLSIPCFGQDVIVNGRNTNLYFDNASVPWSSLSSRSYVLSPIGPDSGFCVSMVNNNTTSAHSFTITTFQTGDFNTSDYSHNTGRYAPLTVIGAPSSIAANTTGTFFVKSNGASKIAFVFTGGTTQAGSPDTVDIYGVQTTANGCGTVNPSTGQSYTLSTPNTGTSAAPPIMAISDGLKQSFITSFNTTNPTANQHLFELNSNNSTKTIYLDKVIIGMGNIASATLFSNLASNKGSTCGAGTIANLQANLGVTSLSVTDGNCTGLPTAISGTQINFSAGAGGSTFVIDLKGMILPPNTTTGFTVTNSSTAITGFVNVTMFWYEK